MVITEITMDTKLQDIRDTFADIKNDDIGSNDLIQQMKDIKEKEKPKRLFDFAMAIILGGYKHENGDSTPVINYNSIFFKKSQKGAPWSAAFFRCLGVYSDQVSAFNNESIKQTLDSDRNKMQNEFTIYCSNLSADITISQLSTICTNNIFDSTLYPTLHQYCDNKTTKNPDIPFKYKVNNVLYHLAGQPTPPLPIQQPQVKPYDPNEVTQYIGHCIKTSRKKNIIFTGAPGTGKTYSVEEYVKNKEHKFVQFHGSYDYTDFAEGLRPIERGEQMVFVRMDGTFKALCREAAKAEKNAKKDKAKAPTYYFVIDEINRAELSKVFGELMYCFEKRGSEHKVQTQYHNLPTYGETKDGIEKLSNDIFKDGFYVPENVVIIGTMNDIDRNVETFDFALRRRFDWIPIKANDFMETSLSSMLGDEDISKNLAQRAINMNKVISGESGKRFGLNEDYHIGPAYFKDYDKNKSMDENLDDIWKHNIEPILREYLRGKNGVDKFIDDCHKALMAIKDTATNEPQTTAEDEE